MSESDQAAPPPEEGGGGEAPPAMEEDITAIVWDRVLINVNTIILPLVHMFAFLRLLPRITKANGRVHPATVVAMVGLVLGMIAFDADYAVQPVHRTVGRVCDHKYRISMLILNIPYMVSNPLAFVYAVFKTKITNRMPSKFTWLQKIALLLSLSISAVHIATVPASNGVVFNDDSCGWNPHRWITILQSIAQPLNHLMIVILLVAGLVTVVQGTKDKENSQTSTMSLVRIVLFKGKTALQRSSRVSLFLNMPGYNQVDQRLTVLRASIFLAFSGLLFNIIVWATVASLGGTNIGWRFHLVNLSYAVTWFMLVMMPAFTEELGRARGNTEASVGTSATPNKDIDSLEPTSNQNLLTPNTPATQSPNVPLQRPWNAPPNPIQTL